MNDAKLFMQMAIVEILSNDHKFQLLALALMLLSIGHLNSFICTMQIIRAQIEIVYLCTTFSILNRAKI